MKLFALITIFCLIPLNVTQAKDTKPPRQKLEIFGMTLSGKTEKISVETLEKEFKLVDATIFDPYNKNAKTNFTGIYFSDFIKKYAKPETTKVFVKAIDGYSVETPVSLMEQEKMLLVFKDENGYLSIKRMGPTRVIYPITGTISKEELLRIGLHWVWQIKSIEFRK